MYINVMVNIVSQENDVFIATEIKSKRCKKQQYHKLHIL